MENDDSLARQTNTRLSRWIWNEIREAYKAVHDHHDDRLVEVLNCVQSFVFHAKSVASDYHSKDDVEHQSRNLEKQRVSGKYAQSAYNKSSYKEVPLISYETSIFGTEILPK